MSTMLGGINTKERHELFKLIANVGTRINVQQRGSGGGHGSSFLTTSGSNSQTQIKTRAASWGSLKPQDLDVECP